MTIVQRRDKNKYNNGSKTSFNDYKNDHIKPKLIPTANCYQKEQYINKKKEVMVGCLMFIDDIKPREIPAK